MNKNLHELFGELHFYDGMHFQEEIAEVIEHILIEVQNQLRARIYSEGDMRWVNDIEKCRDMNRLLKSCIDDVEWTKKRYTEMNSNDTTM